MYPPYYIGMEKQAIIGYRRWSVDSEGNLYPMTVRDAWKPGINRSFCWVKNPDSADLTVPHDGGLCHCGFNAFFELNKAVCSYTAPDSVIGAVAGAGKVQIHEEGFRSEEAQVIALCFVPGNSVIKKYFDEFIPGSFCVTEESICGKRDHGLIQKAADKYGVPLFDSLEDMFRFAQNKGATYSDSFKIKETSAVRNGEHLVITGSDGMTDHFKRGLRHRDDDLPASYGYNFDGYYQAWWKNGERHRDGDLPAIITEMENGKVGKIWYKNGQIHRDGNRPAVIDPYSRTPKLYYKNGRQVQRSITFKEGF